MKYKAIIFDMDGTIVDTEPIWIHATKTMLECRGITVTQDVEKELLHKLPGIGLVKCCTLIKKMFNFTDDVQTLVKEKLAIVFTSFEKQACLMDGFEDFHAKARALNLRTALATNANDVTLQVMNKRLDLKHYFGEHMYYLSHVQKGKPDPELYQLAAKQLGLDPTECIAVEDSATGIQAAKAAGAFCIGFDAASRPEQVKDADMIVQAYHEIDLDALLG